MRTEPNGYYAISTALIKLDFLFVYLLCVNAHAAKTIFSHLFKKNTKRDIHDQAKKNNTYSITLVKKDEAISRLLPAMLVLTPNLDEQTQRI